MHKYPNTPEEIGAYVRELAGENMPMAILVELAWRQNQTVEAIFGALPAIAAEQGHEVAPRLLRKENFAAFNKAREGKQKP